MFRGKGRGYKYSVFMCANVPDKLGHLKPARPAFRPLSRASPCLIHGVAYEEDRDEGNEVHGHEGQGHEANEGRSLQGHAVVLLVFVALQQSGDEEESRQQNRRGKLAKAAVFQGRKETLVTCCRKSS